MPGERDFISKKCGCMTEECDYMRSPVRLMQWPCNKCPNPAHYSILLILMIEEGKCKSNVFFSVLFGKSLSQEQVNIRKQITEPNTSPMAFNSHF